MATAKTPKRTKRKKGKKTISRILVIAGFFFAAALIGIFYIGYRKIYGSGIHISQPEMAHIYIPTGSTLDDVADILMKQMIISDRKSFIWLAQKSGYSKKIHPGHYVARNGMSNRNLINMLKTGRQTPVKVMFHNIRTSAQLSGVVARQIEPDSLELLSFFRNDSFLKNLGFTRETILCMFIPNTYEFYWNISAREFFLRMNREYKKFWTDKRRQQAESIGLTPVEVSILASIVDEECLVKSEEPAVAGVYMNRLAKGMPLQADPTIRFAIGDYGVKRILKKHLEINSPYNTYKYTGLPPGPISVPSISAIEAVLQYTRHDYLYFCAKEDLSGEHYFSKSLAQHLEYARQYQRALNKMGVYR